MDLKALEVNLLSDFSDDFLEIQKVFNDAQSEIHKLEINFVQKF